MSDAMSLHPHSGIATVTVCTQGDVRFEDPQAGEGTIGYGGVEWLRAGGGLVARSSALALFLKESAPRLVSS